MNKQKEVLGIDVGGPIIASSNGDFGSDTSFFSDNYLQSKPPAGAFEAIKRLVDERFGERVCIVSKCDPRNEAKIREWFVYNKVFKTTGLRPDNMHFCRTREGKAPICEQLGITHFVDDRLDVLRHLKTVPYQFLFQGHDREMTKYAHLMPSVYHVQSWEEIVAALL